MRPYSITVQALPWWFASDCFSWFQEKVIDDPLRHHLVVNTGLIGYEDAARLIGDATMKLPQRVYD